MSNLTHPRSEPGRFVINQALLAGELERANPHVPAALISAVVQAMVGAGAAVAKAMGVPGAAGLGRQAEARLRSRPADGSDIAGEGLGRLFDTGVEGMAALSVLAVETPLEDWAGEVVTPTDLVERLGVSRSAIAAWRQSRDVIALPKGKRGHVFPVLQFMSGRPLPEIGPILRLTQGNSLVAWRWLMTSHRDLEFRAPIEVLREGGATAVMDAAHRSFG